MLYTWQYLEDTLDWATKPEDDPLKDNEGSRLESNARAIRILAAAVPGGRDAVAREIEHHRQTAEELWEKNQQCSGRAEAILS